MIDFFRGLKSKYNVVNHGSGVYFTTDTYEIIHQGKSYSGISGQVVKDITLDTKSLCITYYDGTTQTLDLPDTTEQLINSLTDEINRSVTKDEELANSISTLTQNLDSQVQGPLAELTTQVSTINQNLSAKLERSDVEALISPIQTTVSSNQSNISTAQNNIGELQTAVSLHTQDIADLTTNLNTTKSDVSNNTADISNLKSTTQEINNTIAEHDLSLQAHSQAISDLAYEQGVVDPNDCYAWYTRDQGLTITMKASYNLVGDYCILNVRDCMLCQGWLDLYYSLPVQVVNSASMIVSNTSNLSQLMYVETVILDKNHVLHLKRVDGQGQASGKINFTITYKYK